VVDALDALFDDRAGVELLCDVVGGGADQLDAVVVGAAVGVGAGEGGEEGVVDVDGGGAQAGEEVGAEDLHVAGEDEQVEVEPQQQVEHPLMRLGPAVRLDGDVVVGDAGGPRLGLEGGVVGDHRDEVGVELAAAPAPQQVDQAVVGAGDEDRDAAALAPEAQLPVHLGAPGDLGLEALTQPLAGPG
jgi:hypothetical protein